MTIPTSAAYTTERAAALAGVPRSTLYYWARRGLVVPSVSARRVKRWSFADLLVLRLVDWLRRDKPEIEIPRVSMAKIRGELARAVDLGERLADEATEVFVDRAGRLHFGRAGRIWVELGERVSQELLETRVNLIRPALWRKGLWAPDLRRPRPTLRIIPGKLAGEPHVDGTRIPTQVIAALARRGFEPPAIVELYPSLTIPAVRDAIDLEKELEANLRYGSAA